MTAEQIKDFIQTDEWTSMEVELRPSKSPSGIKSFYCRRGFVFSPLDRFECDVLNYADAGGTVPLVRILIKGHLKWQGEHALIPGARLLDYVADEAYEITPLHQAFADGINQIPSNSLSKWELNLTQDIKAKAFPAFGLSEGQIYIDYDLVYVMNDLLFMGSKHVDGRAFDSPENRPTNLQIPLKKKI